MFPVCVFILWCGKSNQFPVIFVIYHDKTREISFCCCFQRHIYIYFIVSAWFGSVRFGSIIMENYSQSHLSFFSCVVYKSSSICVEIELQIMQILDLCDYYVTSERTKKEEEKKKQRF